MRLERRFDAIQIGLIICLCLSSLFAIFSFYKFATDQTVLEVKVISNATKIQPLSNARTNKPFKADISNAPLNHKIKKPVIITL